MRCCPTWKPTSERTPVFRISSRPPPVNLIFVARGERMADASVEERRLYATADPAFIGQDVYLFCALDGLATVFRSSVTMRNSPAPCILPDQQFVTAAQTVGCARA